MLATIRHAIIRWRFRRMTAHFDRQIAAARREHRSVNHLLSAKRDFVHAALRGEVSA